MNIENPPPSSPEIGPVSSGFLSSVKDRLANRKDRAISEKVTKLGKEIVGQLTKLEAEDAIFDAEPAPAGNSSSQKSVRVFLSRIFTRTEAPLPDKTSLGYTADLFLLRLEGAKPEQIKDLKGKIEALEKEEGLQERPEGDISSINKVSQVQRGLMRDVDSMRAQTGNLSSKLLECIEEKRLPSDDLKARIAQHKEKLASCQNKLSTTKTFMDRVQPNTTADAKERIESLENDIRNLGKLEETPMKDKVARLDQELEHELLNPNPKPDKTSLGYEADLCFLKLVGAKPDDVKALQTKIDKLSQREMEHSKKTLYSIDTKPLSEGQREKIDELRNRITHLEQERERLSDEYGRLGKIAGAEEPEAGPISLPENWDEWRKKTPEEEELQRQWEANQQKQEELRQQTSSLIDELHRSESLKEKIAAIDEEINNILIHQGKSDYSETDKASINKLLKTQHKLERNSIPVRSQTYAIIDELEDCIAKGGFPSPELRARIEQQKAKLASYAQNLEDTTRVTGQIRNPNNRIMDQYEKALGIVQDLRTELSTLGKKEEAAKSTYSDLKNRSAEDLKAEFEGLLSQAKTVSKEAAAPLLKKAEALLPLIKAKIATTVVKDLAKKGQDFISQATSLSKDKMSLAPTYLMQAEDSILQLRVIIRKMDPAKAIHTKKHYLDPLEKQFTDLRPMEEEAGDEAGLTEHTPFSLTMREKRVFDALSSSLTPVGVQAALKKYSPKEIAKTYDQLLISAFASSSTTVDRDQMRGPENVRKGALEYLGMAAMIKDRISLLPKAKADEIRSLMNDRLQEIYKRHQSVAEAAQWLETAKNLEKSGESTVNPAYLTKLRYRAWQECSERVETLKKELVILQAQKESPSLITKTQKMILQIEKWRTPYLWSVADGLKIELPLEWSKNEMMNAPGRKGLAQIEELNKIVTDDPRFTATIEHEFDLPGSLAEPDTVKGRIIQHAAQALDRDKGEKSRQNLINVFINLETEDREQLSELLKDPLMNGIYQQVMKSEQGLGAWFERLADEEVDQDEIATYKSRYAECLQAKREHLGDEADEVTVRALDLAQQELDGATRMAVAPEERNAPQQHKTIENAEGTLTMLKSNPNLTFSDIQGVIGNHIESLHALAQEGASQSERFGAIITLGRIRSALKTVSNKKPKENIESKLYKTAHSQLMKLDKVWTLKKNDTEKTKLDKLKLQYVLFGLPEVYKTIQKSANLKGDPTIEAAFKSTPPPVRTEHTIPSMPDLPPPPPSSLPPLSELPPKPQIQET